MTEPERFKPLEDWTVDDHATHQQTGREPETDEYIAHRAEHPLEMESMSPEDHARRKYGTTERNQ